LQLTQEETEDLMNNSAETIHLNDDFNLNISGNNDTDTVFDMIQHELNSNKQQNETECLQPSGPNSANPNLFSRNKLNN